MTEKNQGELIKKYPTLFNYLNNKGPIIPIQFGIECGDGWYMLLDTLMADIVNHLKYNKDVQPVNISQIKEKYGGLRFYYDGGNEYIRGAVSMAESLSYHICEKCGTTINVGQTKGWIYTICKSCYSNDEIANKLTWKKN